MKRAYHPPTTHPGVRVGRTPADLHILARIGKEIKTQKQTCNPNATVVRAVPPPRAVASTNTKVGPPHTSNCSSRPAATDTPAARRGFPISRTVSSQGPRRSGSDHAASTRPAPKEPGGTPRILPPTGRAR